MKLSQSSLILLLSAIVAITPLSIDMYLPAMPSIAEAFGVSLHMAEATVSIFFLGFGLGQLFGGFISDQYGRKQTTLLGLIIFTFATLGILNVPSIEGMLICRFIEAFGGGFVAVNAAAIVRDRFEPKDSARILSTVASIMMIAPMVAPLIGSFIIKFGEWDYIFYFLSGYALFLFVAVASLLDQKKVKREKVSFKQVLQSYTTVFKHRQGFGYLLTGSFATAGMFTFITKASFIYMEHFKISESMFPIYFGANVCFMIVLSKTSSHLVKKWQPKRLLKIGLLQMLTAGSLLFLYTAFESQPNLYVILPLNVIYVASLGFVFGNVDACCLAFFPKNAGVANALFGVTKFGFGAVMGLIVGLFEGYGFAAPFMVMFITSVLANFTFTTMTPEPKKDLSFAS
ncbi:multidrug effflux MFS transporter [Sediminitomix flava]|uniref:DHA1 family bicyclomycin/chloramphenicol resistance-like MFS transporter n=1 Tax=Sediminitomix flava TaxID=379075 RepID=A0A315ZER3_SEDFL|nr:multidrug effflux MFS transporter [Sediminitomix flava]PWJ44021.1 DHA1 family bicyclomycin/chloramphenicol resistance-like MFS transporter [Sediminitomix flava]